MILYALIIAHIITRRRHTTAQITLSTPSSCFFIYDFVYAIVPPLPGVIRQSKTTHKAHK